jgi:hypothetical protein
MTEFACFKPPLLKHFLRIFERACIHGVTCYVIVRCSRDSCYSLIYFFFKKCCKEKINWLNVGDNAEMLYNNILYLYEEFKNLNINIEVVHISPEGFVTNQNHEFFSPLK